MPIRIPLLLAFAIVALSAGDAPGIIQDEARYPTPEESPAFGKPTFISQPPPRAYPGAEFNMRPAVTGGTWPYRFALRIAPPGMVIDPRTGTITWLAPQSDGEVQIAICLVDQAGRTAEQCFSVTVGKEGFFFVSPSGDDANPGTCDKPWKTVVRAAQPVADAARATLYLRSGTYPVEAPAPPDSRNVNVLRICSTSPRRWVAWPGDKPVIDLGWTEEKWQQALTGMKAEIDAKDAADPNAAKARKRRYAEATTRGLGHRIYIDKGTDNLLFDGLEVKNANYYMFVMWHGQRSGLTWRRCNLHHLYADGPENPAFIFGFAAERTYERMPGKEKLSPEEASPFGRRPRAEPYRHTVVQECIFADRRYDTLVQSGHGGGIVWYSTQGILIEDNRFERIEHGVTICDKDNGWDNTYRNNVFLGTFEILAQGCADGINIHHNYIAGPVKIGVQPGWVRNIWFHHNAVRGPIGIMNGAAVLPDSVDPAGRTLSGPTDPESQAIVRDLPREQRLVFIWGNAFAIPAVPDESKDILISRLPEGPGFANRQRFVWYDRNLVDEGAMTRIGYTRTLLKWSELRACGVDLNGVQGQVVLDGEGHLPADSPWRNTHGRDAGLVPPSP